MGVEGTAEDKSIIAAVEAAGYGAAPQGKGSEEAAPVGEEVLEDRETPALKRRLIASVIVTAVLMYFSMGHMMLGWPIPGWLTGNHVAMGLLQMILAGIVMIINHKFFINGFRGLIHRAPNMDTLVALGSMASYVWSVIALFLMTDAQVKGDMEQVMNYMDEFYFESAAMILTLITVGKTLEARSKGKTTDALKGLIRLSPQTAVVLRGEKEEKIPVAQVNKGDIFLVRPGESIPVDGIIVDGTTAVNESALTGESIPADKTTGDMVYAATINQSGFIRCEASRVGEDTTLSQIIRMVRDAAATKAPIAKIADRVSGVFVPVVMAIAAFTVLVWLFVGEDVAFSLARGISVLVISCPCALGLATPVAIMVGNGLGAKNGILFKTAVSLEETGKTAVVALDKTGTITAGEPKVTDILPAEGVEEVRLLTLTYSLEKNSEHPLARAIVDRAGQEQISVTDVSDFQALPGNGVEAIFNGKRLLGGSVSFMEKELTLAPAWKTRADSLSDQGKTPLLFALGEQFLGMIAVADVIKEDSPRAVKQLQNMGIHVVMLTGDNEKTARAIGRQAGVDEVIAGVLPQGKEQVIRSLQSRGKVAMVGDGINDAPALTRADIGIAIGAGTDVAIDAADVVLMKSRLTDVPAAIRLSRATLTNIHENLFWAFFYNVIGIPLAAGVWIRPFHWQLNPMFAAAAMSLSSFCVVSNALRLNLFKLHDESRDKMSVREREQAEPVHRERRMLITSFACDRRRKEKKEKKKMTKTMKIEGMMCGHCEATVKKALESLPQVESAAVSHQDGSAVVTLKEQVADDVLKKTVEEKDYKVTSIN
jgi:Cu2+-exporting ATPase